MSAIYLKSLSGEIISLDLYSILNNEESNIIDIWNRIISEIARKNKCDDYRVVIFEDDYEENVNPPILIPYKQYNFLIRDSPHYRYSINITFFWKNVLDYDYEDGQNIYNKYSIKIYDSVLFQTKKFDIYEQKGINDFYYNEKDVLCIYHDENNEDKITSLKIKNPDNGFISMYSILCNTEFSFAWYDRKYIIERIMTIYNGLIEEYT